MSTSDPRTLAALLLLAWIASGPITGYTQPNSPPDRHWHIEVEDLRPDPENGLVIDWVYFVFHDGNFDLYDYGKPAPEGLRWLANHGYRDRLVDQAFEQLNDEEWQWVQIQTPFLSFDGDNANGQAPGPFFVPEGRYLTYFARVYPSDDAFVGNADPQRYELIDENGDFTGPLIIDVYGSDILDAGTKENLEADLIGLDRHFSDERGDPFEEPFTSDPVLPHPGYNGSQGNPDGEPVRLMVGGETYCQESGTDGSFCYEYNPASIDFSQPGYPLMRLRINRVGPLFHGAWSGSYFNPALSGEGFSFEFFDENPPRALFYWYTFQPDGSGEPMWLIGEGWLDEETTVLRIGSISTPFSDFQRYPEPCQTAPDPYKRPQHAEFHPIPPLRRQTSSPYGAVSTGAGLSSTSAAAPRTDGTRPEINFLRFSEASRPVGPACLCAARRQAAPDCQATARAGPCWPDDARSAR